MISGYVRLVHHGDAPNVRQGRQRLRPTVVPGEIARRLAPAMHWPGGLEVDQRSWRLVARTADFDAWLIAWPSGGKVELHDHGGSRGGVSVVAGTLVEAVPRRDDSGRLSLVRTELCAGTTLDFGAGYVHDVTNESDTHALSLHVYSPALISMTSFELSGDRLVARGLHWAYEGREELIPADDVASFSALEATTQ
jgi:hypothetical protein